MIISLIIRPKHQLVFYVREIRTQISCSTTRDFTSRANRNPNQVLELELANLRHFYFSVFFGQYVNQMWVT
jgi:hypothetical protein